jgi:hypothetical protein
MKKTLTDIQVEYDDPISIYCDNTSTINISKNPVMHSKTKHIPIKYQFLWEQVVEKNIRVEYVGTKEQVEDIFTKPLPREAFEYLRQRLGVISTPKWMLLNAYLICLICTRGSTINRKIQVGISISGRVLLGGASPDGKIPLPLMTKGKRFIICKGKCLERDHRGMFPRGSIVTREEWAIWLQSDTLCQRGRYYSYEGRESNQRLINTKKNQRHVDRGSCPKESLVKEWSPKGRYPFPLMSKGERYKHWWGV